jgi:SAM-dependent methyltransferase
MGFRDSVLSLPLVYRLWQAPFLAQKLAPLFRHNDVPHAKHVLDVGCGPGSNTRWFLHADYVGLDLEPAYICRTIR